MLLHEWLLASPHRTFDPSEADWFYVPVYATCAIVTHIFETPSTPRLKYRVARAAQLYQQALAHVRDSLPYWNASGGVDHIWTFGYDEGACFAPSALRPSLLISHWGNTMAAHNRSTTTYDPDRWDPPYDPPSGLTLSSLRGNHACYDPTKDIILPSFKDPARFAPDPAGLDSPQRPRQRLFFFSGDLGSPDGAQNAGPHTHVNYSLGLRQAAYRAARGSGGGGGSGGSGGSGGGSESGGGSGGGSESGGGSGGKSGGGSGGGSGREVEVVGHLPQDWWHAQYAARLRSSIFCGAFPGDGWSGGISSAVLAGCVPVIVMDGIDMPF